MSVEDFLHRIPLDRVWEIHLAGGEERDGYWLDSHSGPVQRELAEMAAEVVPRLPNLGALIFEIFPAHLQAVGLGVLERQIEDLHRLWDRRGRASRANRRAAPATPETAAASDPAPRTDDGPSPRLWEDALGALTVGQPAATPQARELARELAEDPGVAVARNLLGEFRAGMIVRTLKLTGRLLLLTVGPDGFRELLRGYWAQRPPHLFASAEADGFCDYLEDCSPDVPWLQAVAAFERAANATLIDGEYRLVPFPVDPMPLLRALAEGRLPDPDLVRPGDYEVEVTPEDAAAIDVVLGQRLTDTAGSAAPPPPSTARGVAELTSPRIHHH